MTKVAHIPATPESMRARAVEVEGLAQAHLDHGRIIEARDALAWAAELRRLAATRGRTGLPKRTQSWQVER